MNYQELQTQVADYMHRTDLAAQIPGFIEKARTRINRDLRAQVMIAEPVTLTPTTNPFVVPQQFIEMRDIYYEGAANRISLTLVGRKQLDSYARNSGGRPWFYSLDGYWIETAPSGIGTEFTFIYYMAEEALVNPTDENATMFLYPTIWLYASLIEAHSYAQDLTLMEQAVSFYTSELSRVNNASAEALSGASLQMEGASQWL